MDERDIAEGYATEAALAALADDGEKQRLLELLREHLTIKVFHDLSSGNKLLKVEVDFAGEPITSDWVHTR